MAIVFYSGHISHIRGSIGGNTHSNNLAGNFIRSRTRTPQKQTIATARQKNNFTSAMQAWQFLDPTDVAQWNTYSPQGVSGFNVFAAYHLNALKIGQVPLLAPVPISAMTPNAPDFLNFNSTVPYMQVNLIFAANPNDRYVIFASPPLSPNKQFNRGLMKLCVAADFSGGTVYDIKDGYFNAYGFLPPSGSLIWVSIEQIDYVALNALPSSQISTIVI